MAVRRALGYKLERAGKLALFLVWLDQRGARRSRRSDHYQTEIDHLRIARSPAYHYEPENNGCAEKFIQTLKEQVLWIERFATFEELRAAVREFAATYNEHWLLERHGYCTPIEARQHLLTQVLA